MFTGPMGFFIFGRMRTYAINNKHISLVLDKRKAFVGQLLDGQDVLVPGVLAAPQPPPRLLLQQGLQCPHFPPPGTG